MFRSGGNNAAFRCYVLLLSTFDYARNSNLEDGKITRGSHDTWCLINALEKPPIITKGETHDGA